MGGPGTYAAPDTKKQDEVQNDNVETTTENETVDNGQHDESGVNGVEGTAGVDSPVPVEEISPSAEGDE